MNLIDGEYGSAEFSDLYLRLLSAALDETNSSLSPRMRETNLNAHVARGISMADMASPSILSRGYAPRALSVLIASEPGSNLFFDALSTADKSTQSA